MIPASGSRLAAIGGWLYRRAENVLATMLAVMFAAFVLQIAFRYLFGLPTGWTSELSSILWIWLVLWGAAFVVREEEEIRLDLIHGAAGPGLQRAMLVVSAGTLIFLYAWSLPAVADYVTFMKVEKSASLKIRFDWLFSIYLVFVAAILARYLWLGGRALLELWRAMRPGGGS